MNVRVQKQDYFVFLVEEFLSLWYLYVTEKSTKKVSFTTKGKKQITLYQPIIFNEVFDNHGECYNPDTGKFTVQIPGIYTLSATVRCNKDDPGSRAVAWLMVDDEVKMWIAGSYYSSGSATLSLHLSHGQSVWIKAWDSEDTFSDYDISFSGALVQPDV